jgi:D-3-phosphoglycerate dehydrogenase
VTIAPITVPITPRSFRQVPGEHHALLEVNGLEARYPPTDRVLREDEMVELVSGCRVLLVGVDPVSEAVMAAGPLAFIAKYGSGLDNVDLAAAGRRGIRVVATPGMNAPSVAELTVALMFALARHLAFHWASMASGTKARRVGIELAGRRLGVLGYGAVGRRVAVLGRALGMSVAVHDAIAGAEAARDGFELVTWEALPPRSDLLTVHVPHDESTHQMVGREALSAMPAGSLLLNTARPDIVDAAALIDALENGHLGGAAFDDMGADAEANARLLASDRFIATPHCGAATVEATVRTGSAAVRAIAEHRGFWAGSP